MMPHAKNEYHPRSMAGSGAPHRVLQPSSRGGSGQSFDSTSRRADPAFGITQSEPNQTTASAEEFVDE